MKEGGTVRTCVVLLVIAHLLLSWHATRSLSVCLSVSLPRIHMLCTRRGAQDTHTRTCGTRFFGLRLKDSRTREEPGNRRRCPFCLLSDARRARTLLAPVLLLIRLLRSLYRTRTAQWRTAISTSSNSSGVDSGSRRKLRKGVTREIRRHEGREKTCRTLTLERLIKDSLTATAAAVAAAATAWVRQSPDHALAGYGCRS